MSGQLQTEIGDLQADVQSNTSVTQSAVALINGFSQRLADAVEAAKAAGATEAQLQAISELHTALSANTQQLADSVAANTPAAAPAAGGTPEGVPQPDA